MESTIKSLQADRRADEITHSMLVETLEQTLSKEVKSKNKLVQKLIASKQDIVSLIQMTRNKLLSKYKIYEDVDRLSFFGRMNKSIDEVEHLLDESFEVKPLTKDFLQDTAEQTTELKLTLDHHAQSESKLDMIEKEVMILKKNSAGELTGLQSLYTNKSELHQIDELASEIDRAFRICVEQASNDRAEDRIFSDPEQTRGMIIAPDGHYHGHQCIGADMGQSPNPNNKRHNRSTLRGLKDQLAKTPREQKNEMSNWIPDDLIKYCQECKRKFTQLKRKHHC